MTQWGSKRLGDQGYSAIESYGISTETICISMWQKKSPGFLPPGQDMTWILVLPAAKYSSFRNS